MTYSERHEGPVLTRLRLVAFRQDVVFLFLAGRGEAVLSAVGHYNLVVIRSGLELSKHSQLESLPLTSQMYERVSSCLLALLSVEGRSHVSSRSSFDFVGFEDHF